MMKNKLDRQSLTTIYTSYIRPILEYSDVVWSNCSQYLKNLLESIQVEAARIITGLRRGTPQNILYKELGWVSLENRRKQHKMMLMYKIMTDQTPYYLKEIIEPYFHNSTLDRYNLRSVRIFDPPLCRTANYYNSFFPTMLNEMNSIASDLQNIRSSYQFKKLISPTPNSNTRTIDIFKYSGNREINIILCQLRNEASNLNNDLYNDYLSESSTCSCGSSYETASHYFLECTLYTEHRTSLFQNINHETHNHLSIDVILHGCERCDENINKHILLSVTNYIINTRRFRSTYN